jgi:carbonic anhydrase/acetyltransferase-like protein (isoleucine patch superfamily)
MSAGVNTQVSLILALGDCGPVLDSTVWVAPGARAVGNVTVGADSSLWYGAVLRAESEPIRIGQRTNLQDNVVVHTDPGSPATIGDDVSVGHAAVLHGCAIGDGCLIGMAAVVMNGAVIGAGSLVAAGAVVSERMQVPPGSLVVGVLAVVRRPLRDNEIEHMRGNAATYVALAHQHRDALDDGEVQL